MRSQVDDVASFEQSGFVVGFWVLLQADEAHVGVEDVCKLSQRDRSVEIVAVIGITGPDQTDPKFFARTQAIFPGSHALRRGNGQIGCRWNGIEPCSECKR